MSALAFIRRRDGRGLAAVGGFCEIGTVRPQHIHTTPQRPNRPSTTSNTNLHNTGETLEQAVLREVQEETGAVPYDLRLLGVYSHPDRDDRRHTVSATYVASITGKLKAGDDAKEVALIRPGLVAGDVDALKLAFDHGDFLRDYFAGAGLGVGEGGFEGSPRKGTSLCPIADRRGFVVGGEV